MDVLLLDLQCLTDREQLFGSKHATIISEELLRRTTLLNGGIEDDQNTGEILTLKNITGENGSQEGVHDGDYVEGVLGGSA